MQFEQPPELNRYVDSTIPLTWAVRWRLLKPGLPLLCVCSLLMVEQAAFRLWLNDRSLLSALPLLLTCALFPVIFLPLVGEVQVRLAHRSKRSINLQAKRVSISPAKYNRIAWKQIRAWRLEPVASGPGLTKLTIDYALGNKGRMRREWSMILRQSDQEHAFLSELECSRQMGSNGAPVVRCVEQTMPQTSKRRVRSVVAFALGLYLLLHGLPLFLVGLTPPTRHSDEPQSNSRFSPKERAKLKEMVGRHFSSPQQFHVLLVALGGGLTALGGGLYFWSLSAGKRADRPALAAGSTISAAASGAPSSK